MNSLCVCDAYGMCPQGCAHCAVCGGTDDPPPLTPGEQIQILHHEVGKLRGDLAIAVEQRDAAYAEGAAAERERIRQLGFETEGNDGTYLLIRADLLDGGSDGQ